MVRKLTSPFSFKPSPQARGPWTFFVFWGDRVGVTAIVGSHTTRFYTGWLRGPASDLTFTIGGVFFSLAFLALHLAFGVSAVVLWWVWILAIDGPHIFGTLARTYLDRQEWRNRTRLFTGSLAWFAVGPLCVALSVIFNTGLFYHSFLAFAALWAYWHVVRQHYGVMVLYKKKNADLHPVDDRIDSFAIYAGQLGPLVAFVLTHPQAQKILGLSGDLSWAPPVVTAAWLLTAVAMGLFFIRQLFLASRRKPVNLPKLLLLTAVIGLASLVFSPKVAAQMDFLAFFVVVTVFHNVQYHAVVWSYLERRYRGPGDFGWAQRLASHFAYYAITGVIFTLIYRGLGCGLGAHPGCSAPQIAVPLGAGLTGRDLAIAFMWGFALHHYYLDQKIWRVKKDAQLNRDLNLPGVKV